MGGHHAYRVRYVFKTTKGRTSYEYQRFFRAIYGYTQVVAKANGKKYTYRREGVLTAYPYVKEGKSVVVIPENALTALVDFFKTRRNPAHVFEYVGEWRVSYSIEETYVPTNAVIDAILRALDRIYVPTGDGEAPASTLLRSVRQLDNNTAAQLVSRLSGILESSWYKETRHVFTWSRDLEDLLAQFKPV